MVVWLVGAVGSVLGHAGWSQEEPVPSEVPLEQTLRREAGTSETSTVVPLKLEEAIAYALEHNPQLAASREEVGIAAARVGQAKAQKRFNLTANYRRTYQGPAVEFAIPDPSGGPPRKVQIVPDQADTYAANLSKVLWSGGRLEASERLARRGLEASCQELRGTRQSVVLQVTEAYLGVLKAQELREVARQSVAQAQEHRRIAQLNLEAGTVAPYDVLRADVEVANSEERRLAAENGVALAKAALNTALGRDPNTPIEVVPIPWEISPPPDGVAVLEEALASRPELISLQKNLQGMREGVKIARAGRRPNIVIDANYYQQSTTTGFSSKDYSWNASVVVSVPIWEGGLSRAQENERRQQERQLRQTYEQIRQGIELEIKQALLSIEEARQRIATAETAVTQAEESLRIAQVRYEAGVSTSTELIDAEVALTLARTNRVNAIYDYVLAWARLNKARGAYAGEAGPIHMQ